MASTTLTLLVINGQRHESDCCGWGVDDNAFPEAVVQLRACPPLSDELAVC